MLIVDFDYAIRPEQICWIPGAQDLIRLLNLHGVKVMIATNQSGVARGYFGEMELEAFHQTIQDDLLNKGLWIDAIEYCPHHPTIGSSLYTCACTCRKPGPGMILKLVGRFNLNPRRTLMIGDRETDMIAAANAEVEGLLFKGTNLFDEFVDASQHYRIAKLYKEEFDTVAR